jgi:hypothetical protein
MAVYKDRREARDLSDRPRWSTDLLQQANSRYFVALTAALELGPRWRHFSTQGPAVPDMYLSYTLLAVLLSACFV